MEILAYNDVRILSLQHSEPVTCLDVLTKETGFSLRTMHVSYVVKKCQPLGQFSSKYYGFPCKLHFHRFSKPICYHPRVRDWYMKLKS